MSGRLPDKDRDMYKLFAFSRVGPSMGGFKAVDKCSNSSAQTSFFGDNDLRSDARFALQEGN
jgi:hypothetical protein